MTQKQEPSWQPTIAKNSHNHNEIAHASIGFRYLDSLAEALL